MLGLSHLLSKVHHILPGYTHHFWHTRPSVTGHTDIIPFMHRQCLTAWPKISYKLAFTAFRLARVHIEMISSAASFRTEKRPAWRTQKYRSKRITASGPCERSNNFVSAFRFHVPELVVGLMVKQAAAGANRELGQLQRSPTLCIGQACARLMRGDFRRVRGGYDSKAALALQPNADTRESSPTSRWRP